MTVRDVIEQKAGRALEEVLAEYASRNESRSQLARDYGVRCDSLCHYLRRNGLGGPFDDKAIRIRAATNAISAPAGLTCTIRGERRWYSLGELSELTGISYTTLYYRWQRGEREEGELLRSPGPGRKPHLYELGWSERDWRHALELVRRSGAKAAAFKLSAPVGALKAAERGEWHRIG
ncbi:MAG: hypothetical protein ACLFRW_08300 [Halorhodospira sp.]